MSDNLRFEYIQKNQISSVAWHSRLSDGVVEVRS